MITRKMKKKNFKMIIAWARNGVFAPTHLEKYGPSSEFIKSLSKHVIFDSATRSGGRELGNAGCILLASTI